LTVRQTGVRKSSRLKWATQRGAGAPEMPIAHYLANCARHLSVTSSRDFCVLEPQVSRAERNEYFDITLEAAAKILNALNCDCGPKRQSDRCRRFPPYRRHAGKLAR
jgi:hypothetical protein